VNTGGPSFLSMSYGFYFRPAISYYVSGAADLKLATFEDGRWNLRTVSSKGAVGQYSAITFKSFFDPPQVYYFNRSRGALDLVATDFDHSARVTEVANNAGRYLSVASSGGDTDVIYFDATANALVVRKAPELE
jgi:hypothetical protein